jgi:hypothetical protein
MQASLRRRKRPPWRPDPVVQQLRREQRELLVELAKAEKQVILILRELAKLEPAASVDARINRIIEFRGDVARVHHGSPEYTAVLKRILSESRNFLRLSE